MLRIPKAFWTAVSTVFADAWAEKPTKSRLTHGVGIISLGFLMDAIADTIGDDGQINVDDFVKELDVIDEFCSWTSGIWEFSDGSQRKWNELQNTSNDTQPLTNHILALYRTGGASHKAVQLRLT
jgi:hypothetical protein